MTFDRVIDGDPNGQPAVITSSASRPKEASIT
jgi:hypothetical protein